MIIDFFINVIRNNVFFKRLQIDMGGGAQINVNNKQTIKRELQCSFYDDPSINLLTDHFAPHQVIDGVVHPLGRFIACEAPKSRRIAGTRSLRAYGLIYLADELSRIDTRLTIPAGTKYTEAIKEQLILAGITNFIIEASNATIWETREDWEPGEKRITIINQLCDEINYNHIYDDNNGVVHVMRYRRIQIENVDFTYKTGPDSVLYPEDNQEVDMFARPNVFQLVCENPEKEEMVARSMNNDPSSPISTINIGRQILRVERVDNVASMEELQNRADNIKFENLMVPEYAILATGPRPQHDCYNILAINKDDIQGIYQEESWTLELKSPGKMNHRLRKVTL